MDIRFTDREMDIIRVLWRDGPSTVGQVRDALEDDLAYNTVLTMLRLMEEKGQVGRSPEGRAHRYHALVDRETAGRTTLRRIADRLFEGSREALLLGLVDSGEVDEAELRRMRDLLEKRLAEEDGP
ncbi:MAG: BlaI/MecI/CopY family transcriptional regulator [Gemmatimonadales bacterium]|jgi:predicted transcriptional regulator|nr:MAG: BlaI/MecI/CopY family transcriptional regulator [Gemmatimonadales bacterium]